MTYAVPAPWHVSSSGTADAPFDELRDILARVVAAQGGGGAALAIYRDGRPVVDLVSGGYAEDSVQSVFSVSKAIAAVQVVRLHADGRLDLDAPVGDCWPEFRKSSTVGLTTRMVLAHQSGIPAVDPTFTLEALAAGAEDAAVAAQEPYWQPGTAHGYHAFTYGTLIDGVVRRATGRGIAEHIRDEITAPLGADTWFGISDAVADRVRPVLRPRTAVTDRVVRTADAAVIPPGQIGRIARTRDVYNDPLFRTAGFPAVGAISDARSLARIFAATLGPVEGVRLLDTDALAELTSPRAIGFDRVLGIPISFGSGVQLPFPQLPLLGPRSFGHEGAGGSVVFADPEWGISVGYVTDMFPPLMGAGVGFDTLLATIRHALVHNGKALS
ncbi:serine hydrolase domain-containing protein [Microbacterium invictum]|uniref:CubicO group peptidase (Beta-lactamase class C family) n=1 Tax=Microbacterium invictum TaxID=515415 RepID=A0AA40VNC5_9MICO|nr:MULTISPECIES: serine hydrolase domain-containing protein [Microbacterium]MBB4140268.1 CubicO group peptidase (beta-lactamase class C family) [Microbacterium invictum]